jgi:hypothetical protein
MMLGNDGLMQMNAWRVIFSIFGEAFIELAGYV